MSTEWIVFLPKDFFLFLLWYLRKKNYSGVVSFVFEFTAVSDVSLDASRKSRLVAAFSLSLSFRDCSCLYLLALVPLDSHTASLVLVMRLIIRSTCGGLRSESKGTISGGSLIPFVHGCVYLFFYFLKLGISLCW